MAHASLKSADGFEPVARVADVRDGAPLGVSTPGGARICLVRSGGAIRALADGCTHQEFPLSAGDVLPDGSIQCPWHGARFDCRTGAVLAGPACDPVRVWEVRVEGDAVFVRDEARGHGKEIEATQSRGQT